MGMASIEVADPEIVGPTVPAGDDRADKRDINEIERTQTGDFEKKDAQDYDKVDGELAKYVAESRIQISEERSNQLRRMIDKRVLVVMICTYFLQAIDKGTLSFASIMGIVKDTGLVGQQVRYPMLAQLTHTGCHDNN
jgi:hypothetical protein